MKRTYLAAIGVAAISLAFGTSPAAAQNEAAEQIRSVLDGVYTAGQADRGEAVFQQECGICHSQSEFKGTAFLRIWDNQTVDQLFQLIMSTMPQDSPGRLQAEEYAAVISYFLRLNSFPAGDTELPSDLEELGRIRIESGPNTGS